MMNRHKRLGLIAIGFGLIVIATILSWTAFNSKVWATTQVRVGENWLSVRIAETPEEQTSGLSDLCQPLKDNEGMLFVFTEPTQPAFWMKNMRFPIDIIWVSEGRVVGWETNLTPGESKNYLPPQSVDRVLEVSAEWVEKQDIQIDTPVQELL